jgi:hypothetical protein
MAIRIQQYQPKRQPPARIRDRRRAAAIDHATRLIYRICCLAGSTSLIDDVRAELKADGVRRGIAHRDTAAVFDWLISALSYQGISNDVAYQYMERHGQATWADIDRKLAHGANCPKLQSYGLHASKGRRSGISAGISMRTTGVAAQSQPLRRNRQ